MSTTQLNVLLVEDDPNLGNLLQEYLQNKGYNTTLACDGEEGFKAFAKGSWDFLILDVMMPKKDGFSLAADVRKHDAEVPIIFLTAKSMKEDTLKGFNSGADDYMTKPFSMEELLMRMAAILRRTRDKDAKEDPTTFEIGNYKYDYKDQGLTIHGERQRLTSKENELLRLLCLHMNDVLDRSFALKAIWDDDSYFNSRSMDVYITKLRKHLKQDPKVEIVNVHGKGFKLKV